MKVYELCPEMVDKISFDLRLYAHAPVLPGCYILTNIYEDVLYVGQTLCLQRRMKEHLADRRMTQRTRMGLGCVDISPQPDESGGEMKEAKVSGVQLLKPGEYPPVMLYLVDEAFDQVTLPV